MNTNQEIVLEVAEIVGADVIGEFDRQVLPENSIAFKDTEQLLAFVNAYNARMSEPVAWLVDGVDAYADYAKAVGTAQANMRTIYNLYKAPQPPKAELTDEYKAYVKRLEDALSDIGKLGGDEMNVKIARNISFQALANKPK